MKVKKVLKRRSRDLSFLRFQEVFATEKDCRDYLAAMKWSNGFHCEKCGHDKYYLVKKYHLYQCAQCKKQHSVTAGTLLHKTHLGLKQWFWAIYLVSRDKRGFSAVALKNALQVSYPTAWLLLHKIRTAMETKDRDYILDGIIVVDDAFFGGKTIGKKRGRGTEKQNYVIALSITQDHRPRFVKMKSVESMETENVEKALEEMVQGGSKLISDGHKSLINLKGYSHEVMIMSREKSVSKTLLKDIHIVISNAKASLLGTYHGVSKKHRQKYLNEYCYRFNRRFCEPQIFGKLVRACVIAKPFSFA